MAEQSVRHRSQRSTHINAEGAASNPLLIRTSERCRHFDDRSRTRTYQHAVANTVAGDRRMTAAAVANHFHLGAGPFGDASMSKVASDINRTEHVNRTEHEDARPRRDDSGRLRIGGVAHRHRT